MTKFDPGICPRPEPPDDATPFDEGELDFDRVGYPFNDPPHEEETARDDYTLIQGDPRE